LANVPPWADAASSPGTDPRLPASRGRMPTAAGPPFNFRAKDHAWNGTPLGWAEHSIDETKGDDVRKQYAAIAAYLRTEQNRL
jgi:hypothetical protein